MMMIEKNIWYWAWHKKASTPQRLGLLPGEAATFSGYKPKRPFPVFQQSIGLTKFILFQDNILEDPTLTV